MVFSFILWGRARLTRVRLHMLSFKVILCDLAINIREFVVFEQDGALGVSCISDRLNSALVMGTSSEYFGGSEFQWTLTFSVCVNRTVA